MHVVCGECPQCRSGNGHICDPHADLRPARGRRVRRIREGARRRTWSSSARYVPLRVGAFLDALGNAVHATQICDLAGKSVAITGFGPIGAMAAAIAEHSGASTVVVTDVSDHALETARRWAASRNFANLHAFNVRTMAAEDVKTRSRCRHRRRRRRRRAARCRARPPRSTSRSTSCAWAACSRSSAFPPATPSRSTTTRATSSSKA